MNILVCIKIVPKVSDVKVDRETGNLIRDGVKSIINPPDVHALKMAIDLKNKTKGKVTVITMGPEFAKEFLRYAIAMGADKAYIISSPDFRGSDTLATSYVLSRAAKTIDNFDLVLTGSQTIDGDTGQVGPELAEHLSFNQATYVSDLEYIDSKLIAKRNIFNGIEKIQVELPALITALTELAPPRYMSVGGVFDAYQKEITTWGLEDIKDKLNLADIGLKGSPTKVKKSFPKQGKGKGVLLTDLNADEAAQAIVAKLQEKYII